MMTVGDASFFFANRHSSNQYKTITHEIVHHRIISIFGVVPILTAAVLLVGFRTPAKIAMPISFLVTVLVAFTLGDIAIIDIFGSSIQGLCSITFDILLLYLELLPLEPA